MLRKSFDIAEQELQRAKRCASAGGMSLNRFIRNGVINQSDCQDTQQSLHSAKLEVDNSINQLRGEIAKIRQTLLEETERSALLTREEVSQSIGRNEELMKTFIRALSKVLGDQSNSKPSNSGERDWSRPLSAPAKS